MNIGTVIRDLIEKVGGETKLLEKAKELQPNIQSIQDISEETVSKLSGKEPTASVDTSLFDRIKDTPESRVTMQPMTSTATPSPAATLSEMESAASSSLKGRVDRFKAPAAVAGGLGLAGSYAATQEEPARFPGDMSQAEVMTERTAQLAPSTPSVVSKETPAEKTKLSGPVRRPTTLAETLGRGPVPEREPSAYETGMESLQQERAAAKEERRAEMDQLAKGELASLIGRSLAQIGAAATGMQKGIDMSGVAQKEMVDWDKRRALVASQYEQRVKELEADRARLERVKERTEDKEERAKIAARQEQLAKDERKFKAEEAAKDREAREAIQLLKAYKDKDEASIKKIQSKAALKAKQIDREITALDKIDGMFELYDVASGDKKTQQEAKIRQALRTQMGPEAVAGEKKSFLGFEYDEKKSVDQIIEDVAKYKADLQRSRDIQEQLSLGLQEEPAPTPAPAATPAAAPTAPQGEEIRVSATDKTDPNYGQVRTVKRTAKVDELIASGRLKEVK